MTQREISKSKAKGKEGGQRKFASVKKERKKERKEKESKENVCFGPSVVFTASVCRREGAFSALSKGRFIQPQGKNGWMSRLEVRGDEGRGQREGQGREGNGIKMGEFQ